MQFIVIKRVIKLLIVCSAIGLWIQRTCAEGDKDKSFATSVVGMQELLARERLLLQTLSDYADSLQKKVDVIKDGAARMREENQKSIEDPEQYLSNPLNAFALVRRMHSDWINWEVFLSKPTGEEFAHALKVFRDDLPTSSDFNEAIEAIQRIQETYNLQIFDMAAGLLNGKDYGSKLSSLDCFTIGFELFRQKDFDKASFWLYAAFKSYNSSEVYDPMGEYSEVKILELYAESLYKRNRFADSIKVLDNVLYYKPNDAKSLHRKNEISYQMQIDKATPTEATEVEPDAYQRCCRGDFESHKPKRLHCRYNSTTTPFLILAPFKTEEVSLDPYMMLFHDVVSDNEIKELQKLVKNRLRRATVYSPADNKDRPAKHRTSKFSWLEDDTNALTLRLNRRIEDMTGFDLVGSELLQVMNYGLGGHYTTHKDFFNSTTGNEYLELHGDRIATVLFYMSDVDQGGATAFPQLNTAIFPKKGMAVMWYNLNDRGEGDIRTEHAACPVIIGSKWVFNKWIRERNQFRRRPCNRS